MNFKFFTVGIMAILHVAVTGRGVAQELDVVNIEAVYNETIHSILRI